MSAATLRLFRKTHLYFGLFIAPALLFFALTGAIQTLSLHEAAGNYNPPALLSELGQVHKKQTAVMPVRKSQDAAAMGRDAEATRNGGHPDHAAARPSVSQPAPTLASKQKQHLPMKIFFLLVALGLFTSTLTGIYMAYKYDRNKLLVTAVLIAGLAVPSLLLTL